MLKTSPAPVYQELLIDISRIYEDAKDSTLISVNKIRNQAYWLIGEKIVKVEQKGAFKAQYGARLIENLSKDLSMKYSQGFSESNLRSMRKFYLTHENQKPAVELSWSHHQLLLKIKDEEKRKLYERKSLKQKWSKRDLTKALKSDDIEVEEERAKLSSLTAKKEGGAKLPVVRGKLYTYKLKELDLHLNHKKSLVVDCGFKVFKEFMAKDLSFLNVGDTIEGLKIDQEFILKASKFKDESLYTYKAFVEKVVDGGTLVINVDCGFQLWANQRVRLKGLGASEIGALQGSDSRHFVVNALKNTNFIVIKTYKMERYDRYLVDVFYLPGEDDPAIVAKKGHFLNQELLKHELVSSQ